MVGPLLDDAALIDHDDPVRVANPAQAMRDDEAGTPATANPVVDPQLGRRVEGACRLIQNQQRGIVYQRPRDLQPQSLAAAEIAPPSSTTDS